VQPPTREQMQQDLRRIALLRAGPVPAALLRAGARRELYAVAELAAGCELLLGPDEDGRWWPLGTFDDAAHAARAADGLRRFLRWLNEDGEGLHVVEHVLLRPVSRALAPDEAAALSLRLTVVLPAWTVRTHDPGFRRFAEETLRLNCPAHLSFACRWLEFDVLARFEDAYGRWMDAKAAHCRALDEDDPGLPALSEALDEASARLLAYLGEVPPPAHADFERDDDG
jgi:hypothetical protein